MKKPCWLCPKDDCTDCEQSDEAESKRLKLEDVEEEEE